MEYTIVCTNPRQNHEPFWGCGGCGEQWASRDTLDEAITASINKFPYRSRCYRKGADHWEPVELSGSDRREYVELVRKEWDL